MRIWDWSSDVCSSDLKLGEAMKKSFLSILFTSIAGIGGFSACNSPSNERTPQEDETTDSLTNEQLLDSVQYRTFQYFWEGAEPTSGMARERYHVEIGRASCRERVCQYG